MLQKTGHYSCSYHVKSITIGSFLKRIVVERANDYLCLKKGKDDGQITAKAIDF